MSPPQSSSFVIIAAFYVDCQPPDYCFVPCGHMSSEKTVKYWANVPIPCGTSGFQVRKQARGRAFDHGLVTLGVDFFYIDMDMYAIS